MDIAEDDPLEFLDFTGVEESEREKVLSSLHNTSSDLQLPWIITEDLPRSKPKQNKKITLNHNNIETNQNTCASPGAFVSHPYNPGQFHSIYTITTGLTPKFSVSPVPYTMNYPGMVPMQPIYTNFHHAPQGMGNNSNIINPVMYSPEPAFTYSQVSPVQAIPQFTHNPQYNMPAAMLSPQEHNGIHPNMVPPLVNNIPHSQPQPTFIETNDAPDTNMFNNADETSININNNNDIENNMIINVQKNTPVEKSVETTSTVSYGVPDSTPFSLSKEVVSPVSPSPNIDKTDNEKVSGSVSQNKSVSNGHNAVENISVKNKSWASLFNKGSSEAPNTIFKKGINVIHEVKHKENNNNTCPIKNPKRSKFVDPTCYRMGEYLLSHTVDGRTISLQPRGLINRSNYCYINSILQALLACPPLYNLLSGLSKNITSNEKRKPTPVIDSMCKLINEFEHLAAGQRVGRRTERNQKKEASMSINCGNPFEPSWIYKMLNGMRSDSFLVEGRQEDAEEFFGCLLNGLNDEIQELMKLVANEEEDNTTESTEIEVDQGSGDWQVMGPKNKGSITRKTVFGKTPISNIFSGLLRSKISRAGDESTNNIQPFFTLQLNIEKAKTVSEALEALVSRNQLEGVTSSKTNEQVEAWQQVLIEELPIILVLHLKCFDYQLNGCTKIMKTLEFPIDLKIDTKLLCAKSNSSKEKQYKLFAVVYHDGKEASKGHYLTDAFHVGYNSWLRYDDASVKPVSEEQVLSPQGCRVPYLLFYRRSDYIRSK